MHERRREPVTIGSPAVASGFTYRFSGAEVTKLISVSFVVVTDANAASRIPRVEFLDSTGAVFFAVAAPFTQAATKTTRYNFGIGVEQFGANDAAQMGAGLPEFHLTENEAIRVAVAAIQAGDQLSGIHLFVDQRSVRP